MCTESIAQKLDPQWSS